MMLHASCVAFGANAVLITGQSGSGKSSLALALMAIGARLVSDDQTVVALRDGWPTATAPAGLSGLIEARGVGLLAAEPVAAARVTLVVDLDQTETSRMPPDRAILILDQPIDLLHKTESPHFVAAIAQYMKGGKAAR